MPVTSAKYKEAEQTVPEPLRSLFAQLVEEYEFLTAMYYGKGYVAYQVLAQLILAGWRPSAELHPNSRLTSARRKL